jgi:hypothetical protein
VGWTVKFNNAARKGTKKLPVSAGNAMELLTADLRISGPEQKSWPHYGKITGYRTCHHCHILKGKTTYVAVWRETEESEIEVTYVGSHENANYWRACKS